MSGLRLAAMTSVALCAALMIATAQPLGAAALQGGQATADVLAGAPLMGTGKFRPLPQFSHDDAVAAATAAEDDEAARAYGLPLGIDDHGSTLATATPLRQDRAGDTVSGSVDGVVEAASDRDVFVIAAGAGPLNANVVTAAPAGRADLVLVLRDDAGHVLAAANPGSRPGPVLAYRIAEAGTYYLEVTAPDGAGGGHFRLNASYAQAAAPLALQLDPAL